MDWLFSAHCCITCGHNYLEVIIRVHASIWSMIALTKVIVWKPIDAIFYFFLGCCQSLLKTLLVMGMLKQKQIKLWIDQTHSITTRNMTWWAFCNIIHVYWGKVQNKCFIQLHNSYDIEKWIHLLMLSFFKLHIMTLDNHLITLIFLLICQTVVQAHILFQEIWLAWIWHSKTGFTACLWWMFNLVSFLVFHQVLYNKLNCACLLFGS